jgi:glucokinase
MLAQSGDPAAEKVFFAEGVYIGRALASVINIINPVKVVLGGGVSESFELFAPSMMETVKNYTYAHASEHVRLEKTGLGRNAALIGAAALAIRRCSDTQLT